MFYPVLQCLSELKNLQQTNIPIYSFAQHQRLDETKYLYGATIIIGMVLLQHNELTLHNFFSGGYTCPSRPGATKTIRPQGNTGELFLR